MIQATHNPVSPDGYDRVGWLGLTGFCGWDGAVTGATGLGADTCGAPADWGMMRRGLGPLPHAMAFIFRSSRIIATAASRFPGPCRGCAGSKPSR